MENVGFHENTKLEGLFSRLEGAKNLSDVLQIYSEADISNMPPYDLVRWQDRCGQKAAETKNGEMVSVEFYKMANDIRASGLQAIEIKDQLSKLFYEIGISRLIDLGKSKLDSN